MFKKTLRVLLTLYICTKVLIFAAFFLNSLLIPYDSQAIKFVPYEMIRSLICYDHIVYNGNHYYMSEQDVPDNFIPFSPETIQIILVDKEGDAYDETRKENARIYINDNDIRYIYYSGATFVKD